MDRSLSAMCVQGSRRQVLMQGEVPATEPRSKPKPPLCDHRSSPRVLFPVNEDAEAPISFVRFSILLFAAITTIEVIATVAGVSLSPTPFACLFYLSLMLRVACSSHRDAALMWPVDKTLLFICVFDRWAFRPRDNLIDRLIKRVKGRSVRFAIKSPLRAARIVRGLLRIARWAAWGMPLVGLCLSLNGHVQRFWIMRKQRLESAKKKKVLAALRARLDEHTSRKEAAERIQALFRGRKARRQVTQQKRSAQLRARAAARMLVGAARCHRARLQAQADTRPLLLRPDSSFVSLWKLTVLAMALLDAVQVLLAPSEDQKLSHAELLALATFDRECTPRLVAGPRKFVVGPRVLVRTPLADHCASVDLLALPLASVVIQLVAIGLGALVAVTATCDVLIEFFTGVVCPMTGVLKPKPVAQRYFMPPFSLCFNILVNPALASANALLALLLAAGATNPYLLLRLVLTLQPVVQHAEKYVARHVRDFCRRHASFFERKPGPQSDAAVSRPYLAAAHSAARLTARCR